MSLTVDGQRQPRDEPLPADFIEGLVPGIRQVNLPVVFEHSGFGAFYEAGGWVDTTPDQGDGVLRRRPAPKEIEA